MDTTLRQIYSQMLISRTLRRGDEAKKAVRLIAIDAALKSPSPLIKRATIARFTYV